MPEDHSPSETTPLLPGADGVDPVKAATPSVEPAAEITSKGTVSEQQWPRHLAERDGAALERHDTNDDRQRQYEGIPELRERMAYMFPALAIGVFLAAADQTLIVSSYGKIGTELDALNKTSWVATAYLLTLTSFQPLYGKLSDIFGRKPCLLFAYLVFGLGCLGCGLARDINELVASRAFAGIGGGGMTTVVSILLSDAIPLKDRGTWQGYINVVFATGGSIGAPLGGLLADSIGWRWAFLFQAPMCLIAFITVALTLKLPPVEKSNVQQKLRRIDFLGAAILVSAIFALLFGLDRGSNLTWNDRLALVALAASALLSALFVLVEVKVAHEPFAPGRIIFHRSLFACYACNFFSFAGWIAAVFYISLYYQAYWGFTPTHAGMLLIPQIVAGVSGSLFGGFYMRHTGRYYWLTVTCYATLVAGLAVILACSGLLLHSVPGTVAGALVCGFSNGIGVTASLIGLISNAQRDDQAIATACSYLFRSLGSTTGVSLSATLFNSTLRTSLARALGSGDAAARIQQAVRRSLESIRELAPDVQTTVRRSYAVGTTNVIILEMGLAAGAAVSAWAIREKALSN